jgi:hypothetical protein
LRQARLRCLRLRRLWLSLLSRRLLRLSLRLSGRLGLSRLGLSRLGLCRLGRPRWCGLRRWLRCRLRWLLRGRLQLDLRLPWQRQEQRQDRCDGPEQSDQGPFGRHCGNLQNLEPKLNRKISSRS